MSEFDDKKQKNADQLDHMSTAELEELLKTHSLLFDNADMDYIFSILEVIENREKLNPSGKYTDVDIAWASFNKSYRSASNVGESLYDFSDDIKDNATSLSDSNEPNAIHTTRHGRRFKKRKTFLRFACVLSVLIIVLFSSTIVARAFGIDLWDAVAKWTNETFGFSTEETTVPTQASDPIKNKFSNLTEALNFYGIKAALVPTRVPDGYTLTNITVLESPKKVSFNAIYNNSEGVITVVINQLTDRTNGTYEKDNSSLTIYEKKDIPHYILSNNEQKMVVWTFENYECYITGDISELDLKNMIDSIYER